MENFREKLNNLMDDSNREKIIWDDDITERFFIENNIAKTDEYFIFLKEHGNDYLVENYAYKVTNNQSIIKEEYLDIFGFYGLNQGNDNIYDKITYFRDILNDKYIPIADVSGGDLICMAKDTAAIYLWRHESSNSEMIKLVDSFKDFVEAIEPFEENIDLDKIEMNIQDDILAQMRELAKKYK